MTPSNTSNLGFTMYGNGRRFLAKLKVIILSEKLVIITELLVAY